MTASDTTGNAHVYARVSSGAQVDGHSLPTQEAACSAYAEERGLTVVSVSREVWSGTDRHRPQLDRLLERLVPGDVVIAYALDRVSRSQVDTAILIDRIEGAGASLSLVTEDFERTATGTFLRNARAFVAELEREKIAERTQRGRRARVSNGKPIPGGKPPYGYSWVDDEKARYELDPEAAAVVRWIFDQALAGASLRAIAKSLDERGILTPYGRPSWTAATVRRILTRELYSTGAAVAFAVRYERKPDGGYRQRVNPDDECVRIENVAPTIVTPEEQAAVLSRLATNQAFSARNNNNPEATLLRAGFARCGHCGWALRVNSPTSSNRARYVCNTYRRGRCANPTITAGPLDEAVWAKVAEILQDPKIIAEAVANHRGDGGLERDLESLEKLLAGTVAKQQRTARAITAVDDDDAATPLIAELKSLAARKVAAERERDELKRRIKDADADRGHARSLAAWCQVVSENLDTLSYDEKRLAMDALGVQVRVWREDAVDEDGTRMPRWDLTVAPDLSDPSIVLRASSSTSGN